MGERFVDRAGWPSGPWDDEADREEWRYRGLPCLIVRGGGGNLCGYVGVPPGHPWHGRGYGATYDNADGRVIEHSIDAEVHGGLTYAARCQENGHICHVARPGEPDDVWWFGFDCAHSGDLRPKDMVMERRFRWPAMEPSVYRTVRYVRREVERLADQVLAADTGLPSEVAGE